MMILPMAMMLLAGILFASCKEVPSKNPERSVYFWSTTFELDSTQYDFLHRCDIHKIYLRFFDVVTTEAGEVMPNATVRFVSPQPDSVEIIPTVFITNDCMLHAPDDLPDKLLSRILQICETHDITGVREIQIDCDWSNRTQKAYFAMLDRLSEAAREQGIVISATIRLHQLSLKVPPVERGVLMMYNTGDIKNADRNPILDLRDVAPYIKHLDNYSLPLTTAYPIFSWDLLYRGQRLVGIMHSDDDLPVIPGDTIIHHEVSVDEVLKAKQQVNKHNPRANDGIILFDLSKKNINNKNHHEYEKIFSD